jgi:hypothetical protein
MLLFLFDKALVLLCRFENLNMEECLGINGEISFNIIHPCMWPDEPVKSKLYKSLSFDCSLSNIVSIGTLRMYMTKSHMLEESFPASSKTGKFLFKA